MALPQEYRNEQLDKLERELLKYNVAELESLSQEDFYLLGMYIQTYNFIEFNIQRVFLLLMDKGIICLTPKENRMNINFPFIVGKLLLSLDKLESDPDKKIEVAERINEIIYRRDHRNVLAHWAGKKIPGKDAFVFFTSDLEDMKRVKKMKKEDDFIITSGLVHYVIYNAADLRGLFTHIHEYEVWIAHKAAEWIEKFSNTEMLIDKSVV
ncbi:hypothetical protein [Yersinia sp. Marseille-Q5920]|uniref:hypothetical protein n=1 Tax=Yersinia sp. Marseille-Q5920 TaxID=2972785 RepID=UPI002264B369|nr:hypothetical protein [Yersinia sp. Marseille-Q5920]